MSEPKNFLEQLNEEQAAKKSSKKKEKVVKIKETPEASKASTSKGVGLESFKEESFIKTKEKTKILPYIMMIIVLLVGFGGYYILSRDEVIVVDFTGMELDSVTTWSETNGVMLLSKEVTSSTVDEGLVVEQNFEAGYSMKAEDTLSVNISAGPDLYELVDLPVFDSSWSKSSVTVWLESNNITNFAFKYIEDDDVEGDYLINYILTGATQDDYSRSASLEFVFSESESEATVIMSNYLGSSLSSFATWAVNEGFNYTYTESYSNIYSEGEIMEQNFTPDLERLVTNDLEVVVSLGPSSEIVTMENLVNMSVAEGLSWLAENGLNVVQVNTYSDIFTEDKIVEQNIEPLAEINKGSTVEIKVSIGEVVVVPDFSDYTYLNHTIALQEYSGYTLVSRSYNSSIPVNEFISQSLYPGKSTDGSEAMEVIYSLGSEIIMPDFRGDTIESISEWVNEQLEYGANLNLLIIEDPELNDDYGIIYQQNLYNKQIELDATIEVTVSTQKVVPDFNELTLEEAQIYAEDCGYSVIFEERYQTVTNYSDFLSQSISAGTEVNSNTIVLVSYSLGISTVIEDYKGQPLSDLKSILSDYNEQGMNINLDVSEYYSDEIPASYIISQNIFNSSILIGETLEVSVSLGESYIMPDFVGYNKARAEYMAEEYGLNIIYIEEDVDLYSGAIISQSIEAGTKISKSDYIHLTISE